MRADLFLFRHGLARSRSHAVELIRGGVLFAGKRLVKPAEDIPDGTDPALLTIEMPSRYVSRGGIKLEAALAAFSVDVRGLTALDLGASTGGFTDCLLQHGAAHVFAVDVGHGQLAASLLADSRVSSMEGVNARDLTAEALGGATVDIAVSDVSFISQTHLYPAVMRTVRPGGLFISLIKPQFEAGRAHIGSGGIVRDRKVHEEVITSLFAFAPTCGLTPCALTPSPIAGGDGNREYLALFSVRAPRAAHFDIRRTVREEN